MFKLLNKIRRNEEGATAIEYGLIAASSLSLSSVLCKPSVARSTPNSVRSKPL
nr:Flp family type IVb pilin [Kordiimonas gwangyangensis]